MHTGSGLEPPPVVPGEEGQVVVTENYSLNYSS